MTIQLMESRLNIINMFMNDPYKSIECKYSLVEDVMNGKFDDKDLVHGTEKDNDR